VGKLEQTSAVASPTNSVMMPTIGQPQTMIAGPPVVMPYPYGVRHPDRTEMVVNETATLLNTDTRLRSSCLQPSSWSRFPSPVSSCAGACALTLSSSAMTVLLRRRSFTAV
jgi:hypothetical protein